MKKTLTLSIALLSGLVSAADLDLTLKETITTCTTANNTDTWDITDVTTSASTNYAYVALLNLETFKDALTKGSLNNKKILSEDHSNFGLGVAGNGTLTFCNVATNGTVPSADNSKWPPSNQQVTLNSSLLTHGTSALAGAALTFSVGHASNSSSEETSGVAGISLLYQDGSKVNIYGSHSGYRASNFSNGSMTSIAGLVDSVSVYSGALDKIASSSNLAAASQEVIAASLPEPTTATLSLLALAGLAARRRRR